MGMSSLLPLSLVAFRKCSELRMCPSMSAWSASAVAAEEGALRTEEVEGALARWPGGRVRSEAPTPPLGEEDEEEEADEQGEPCGLPLPSPDRHDGMAPECRQRMQWAGLS